MLQRVADAGLLKGKAVGIDATTLEVNAPLRSIVRRDTGEGYDAFLRGLAAVSGIATPTRAELARFDRKRRKKGSNKDWTHPKDPAAKIAKMKDGRTHLAHKAEHAVDVETGAVVGVTVQDASAGDTTTMVETLSRSKRCSRPVEAWPRWSPTRATTAMRRWSRWPTSGCAAKESGGCRSSSAGSLLRGWLA